MTCWRHKYNDGRMPWRCDLSLLMFRSMGMASGWSQHSPNSSRIKAFCNDSRAIKLRAPLLYLHAQESPVYSTHLLASGVVPQGILSCYTIHLIARLEPRNIRWITEEHASSWRAWQNRKNSHHPQGDRKPLLRFLYSCHPWQLPQFFLFPGNGSCVALTTPLPGLDHAHQYLTCLFRTQRMVSRLK